MLYANTFHHGYVFDDDIAVRKNALVQQGLAGLPGIFSHGYLYGFNGLDYFYRPVALATLALEGQVFGNDPRAHHAVNIILFASCSALFYLLLVALFRGSHERGLGDVPAVSGWVPLVAALLFAAHPIHTEVVANIKSRDELLCLVFVLFSLRLLVVYVDTRRSAFLAASLPASTRGFAMSIAPTSARVLADHTSRGFSGGSEAEMASLAALANASAVTWVSFPSWIRRN